MHIALVNRWYPPHSGHGGIAMYNFYLSKALIDIGHQVTILSSRTDEAVPAYSEEDGIKIHRLMTKHRYRLHRLPIVGHYLRSFLKGVYSFRVAQRLKQLEKEEPFDVIEFAEVGGEGFFYLRSKTRSRVVVRCHTPSFVLKQYHQQNEMTYDIALTAAMEKFCIRHADVLTAPSKNMAATIADACDIKVKQIVPIPNPLDVVAFLPRDDSIKRETADEMVILHVGRLERVKGIDILLNAIPLVLAEQKKTIFIFVGAARSDEQSNYWMDKLKEAGGSQVRILGFVEQSELLELYRRADIAVVPTLNYESFSYTCAQAMATGLPVVASRIGGISETVDDGKNGVLFETGSVHALSLALIKLIKDKALRCYMGQSGRTKAQTCFSATKVARTMVEVYQGAGE